MGADEPLASYFVRCGGAFNGVSGSAVTPHYYKRLQPETVFYTAIWYTREQARI